MFTLKLSVFPLLFLVSFNKSYRFHLKIDDLEDLQKEYNINLLNAVYESIVGFPSTEITICYENHTDMVFIKTLLQNFLLNGTLVSHYDITTPEIQEKYFEYLDSQVKKHQKSVSLFFGKHRFFEYILLEVYDRHIISRDTVFVFNWGKEPFHRYFIRNIHSSMKVFVITKRDEKTYRVFFNQATSYRDHHVDKINWWTEGVGLFYHPTQPLTKSVYKDFKGKLFYVPVLHKPPWHFVEYNNDSSITVLGGRDERILNLLSKKLHFRYKYIDPPERIQGSAPDESGNFNGVMGLIWNRHAEFFIGDIALTYERSHYVDFSFITLADSGAFVTHAPSKLNEALALLRPFHWQVWPTIAVTFLLVGPVLYLIIALPNVWQPRFLVESHVRLLFDCTWFTTTILLKQTGRAPSSSHKARFFIILLSISATYVINDMYSANLTSLLARPGREKPISNLDQLESAMKERGYHLFVEAHSSSYSLLENGTGVYRRLWELMQRNQQEYLVDSVEEGVKLVRDVPNMALLAGRETLFFDTHRFGATNFHLTEKLNTAYSAMAFQLGCPYIDEFNKILMAIFEAGIITKMTEDEYENLGKQKKAQNNGAEVDVGLKKQTRRAEKASKDSEKLQPISLKMLQGAFYLLCIGCLFSGLMLLMELFIYNHNKKYQYTRKRRCVRLKNWCKYLTRLRRRFVAFGRTTYRNLMHEAFVATLDYLD